jgi:hypothetical protein
MRYPRTDKRKEKLLQRGDRSKHAQDCRIEEISMSSKMAAAESDLFTQVQFRQTPLELEQTAFFFGS